MTNDLLTTLKAEARERAKKEFCYVQSIDWNYNNVTIPVTRETWYPSKKLPLFIESEVENTIRVVVDKIRERIKYGFAKDTQANYPGWGGGEGESFGLIPKESVVDYLSTITPERKESK